MSEANASRKEFIDRIRDEIEAARGTRIWDDYVNALRLISQVVFTRSSGFVMEFIQNAEDSGINLTDKGHFEITVNSERVKICHNGRPFDENDVRAISGIRSSKKPERGFLGYLGIGFKSVLKVSDRPEIYSNGFRFKFDRSCWSDPNSTPWHVMPVWIEKPSEPIDESRTTFIVPFRETADAARISEEIKNIRLELYLFLRWLNKIEITDESSDEHWVLENLGEDEEGISMLQSAGEKRRFKFFRQSVNVPDWVKDDRLTQEYRANVVQRELAIGFALDESGNLAPDEAGAMYGGVYSFLPLGEAKSGAKFPIQADFLVQPGRDALNYEAKWNQWILEEIQKLSLIAINHFKGHALWKYQYLPAFEFSHSPGMESFEKLFYPKLIEPIEDFLRDTPSVLTVDEHWAKLGDVVRMTEKKKAIQALVDLKLFTPEEIAPAFGGKDRLKLVNPKVIDRHETPIRNVDRWDLLDHSDFWKNRSQLSDAPDWFARFYRWLRDYPVHEEYFYYKPRIRTLGYHKYEIVLTAQNESKKGGEVHLLDVSSDDETLSELASLLQSSRSMVHPDVLSTRENDDPDTLRGFLTGFTGVQLLNAKTICKDVVLPKIITKSPQPQWSELLPFTKLCKDALGTDLGHDVDLWVYTKSGRIVSSKEVFLPNEFKPTRNWEKHQQFLPGLNFIDIAYLGSNTTDDELRSWRGFFKAAGVKETPDNGVEQFAINFAMTKLRKAYQNIQLVDKLNYGFDVQGEAKDGTSRQFEVKGLSSDQDVELTGNEVAAADKYKSSFYLCVVSSIPNSPSLHLINNPAQPGIGKKDKLTIPINVWKSYDAFSP